MLARCTSSLDLHMLIGPFWYLFGTLLVPKVANYISYDIKYLNQKKEKEKKKKKKKDKWISSPSHFSLFFMV